MANLTVLQLLPTVSARDIQNIKTSENSSYPNVAIAENLNWCLWTQNQRRQE